MNDLLFINEERAPGSLPPGAMCLANEARLTQATYSQPLTNYVVGGWDQDPLAQMLESLAPAVRVARRFDYKVFQLSEEFIQDAGDEDIRAIGQDFGKVQLKTSSEVTGKTDNKGLKICIDRDELLNDPGLEERRTQQLVRRLLRNDIRRAVNLLSGAAVNTAKTWDTTAGKDPDQDVSAELLTATDLIGIRPNRVFYGDTAWSKRQLAHRAQDNAGGYASAGMTPEQLRAFLNTGQVSTVDAHFRDSATTLDTYLGNLVLMYWAASGMDRMDPSHIKRFVSPVEGGGMIRVYREEVGAKLIEITVEHYSLLKLTFSTGIRQFTVN